MANLNEIHSDVKVLQNQMDTLIEIIKPVSDIAKVVAVHQEKLENISTDLKEHDEELKSLNKWKWTNVGSGGLMGILSAILTHKIGG